MTRGRHIRKIARTMNVPSRILLASVLIGAGLVANSNFQPAKAAVNVAVPSPPTSVNATAGTASISLTWAAPAESGGKTITGYQVEHSTDGENWTTDPTSIAANATSHTITNLTSVARYVRIAAKYSTGIGSYGYPWKKVYATTTPYRTTAQGSTTLDTLGYINYVSTFGLDANSVAKTTYANASFTRVRYLMKSTISGTLNYVDADFSKTLTNAPEWRNSTDNIIYSKDLNSVSNLQIPSHLGDGSKFIVQGDVQDLTVQSNVSAVSDGNGFSGRVEFWPFNYDVAAPSGLTARSLSAVYDDADTPAVQQLTSNYGSFQLHNITNEGSDYRQTVFAWNRHFTDTNYEIGFGSYTGSAPRVNSDWTFCNEPGQTECQNRTSFSLEIFINPTVTPTQGAALTPTFGTPTRTADGFTVQITNYDSAFTWSGTATANGTVAISNTGLVTVSGVAANTSSTATITTTRIGYTTGSATKSETSLSTVADGACSAYVNSSSGVAVYDDGRFCFVAFKNAGSIGSQSTFTWSKPTGVSLANVLVVGGGGGGGSRHGGGGGAGAYVEAISYDISSASTISVAVGAGGAGATGTSPYTGNNGVASTFKFNSTGLTANGGGAGTSGAASSTTGSSSGGSGSNQTSGAVGALSQFRFDGSSLSGITFGNVGSGGADESNLGLDANKDYWAGGGGGGAGSAGARPTSNGTPVSRFQEGTWSTARGGNGGNGKIPTWITTDAATNLNVGQVSGSDVYFAGGGGGGIGNDGAAGGTGGLGGGANGTMSESSPIGASSHTGGGGGGGGFDDISPTSGYVNNGPGSNGGSGVVVIRYAHSYTVSFAANKDQHQAGVTSGSVPSSAIVTSGGSYLVPNQGTLARQGFTFAGWKDQNGNSIAAGSTITVTSDLTLSAQWEIPTSAKLIGSAGTSVVEVKQNGSSLAGNVRGITTDGTYVYFRPSNAVNKIRKVQLDGTFVSDHTLPSGVFPAGSLADTANQVDLSYSRGCIFTRVSGDLNSDLFCIDVSDWSITKISMPAGKGFYASNKGWLKANIIDFPDGRIGAVSAPDALTSAANSTECPTVNAVSSYCKILRLYNVTGTGKNVSLTFSEDIVLLDQDSLWPNDDHGIATDGTYLYQIHHEAGYKVWALKSGSPSHIVYNSTSTGTCPVITGFNFCGLTPTGIVNATYMAHSHSGNFYIVGDYDSPKFYLTPAVAPPAGPGTAAEAPVITAQPQGATKSPGESVSFSVTVSAVTDGGMLSYVWKKNGSVISGANTSTLSLSNLNDSSAGDYTVEVTNTLGEKTTTTISSTATLVIKAAQAQTVTVSSASSVTYGSTLTLTGSGGSGTGTYSFTKVSGDCTLSGTNNSTLTPSAATSCVVKAKRAGDSTYLESSFSPDFTVTINKKALTLTVKPVNRTYNGQSSIALKNGAATPITITKTDLVGIESADVANVDVDLNKIQATVSTPDVANGKTVTATVLSGFLTGTKATNYELPTITVAATVNITQATQGTVTFNPASTLTYGNTLNLLATGGDGSGAYEFAKVSGNCTVTGAVVVPTSGTGTCVVKARKASDTNYQASSYTSDKTITLAKAAQTINFTSAIPSTPIAGGTYAVTATATSALAPTFTSTTSTVCSVSGATVTFNTSGTCTIKSDQAGDNNYNAAASVTQTIVVGQKNQRITFPVISNKYFGGSSFNAGATVDSGLTLSYSSSNASICTVTPATGVVTIVGVGQCSITAAQPAGDSVYAPASEVVRTFDIDPITPTAPRITSVSFGDSSVTVAYSAPSSTGGANILAYRAVATPTTGTEVIKSDCSTGGICEISGLVNGAQYTIVVAATNSAGTGEVSNTSPAITPATTPDAVTNLATVPGDETLAVSWVAPVSFGGGTFTKYEIVATPRAGSALPTVEITSASTTNYTFTGLTNGTAYDVTVTVLSSANTASLASNTTTALGVPATVPSSPRNFTVLELSKTSAFLSWSVPTSNGGSEINGYEVVPAGCTLTNATDTNCIITGQTPGSTVQFTVVAKNEMGSSASATVSHTFTADPPSVNQSPAPQPEVNTTPTSSPSPSAGSTATPRISATPRPTNSIAVTPSATPTPTIKYLAPQSLFPALQNAPYPTGGIEIPNSGEVISVVNGEAITPTITNTAIDTLIEFPDGSAITMWSQTTDGQNIPIEPGGSIKVLQGAVIYAEGTGFKSDSPIEAWLFSEPTRLGGGYANAQGNFSSQFVIGSNTNTGDHTLLLNGVNSSEEVLTLALGVTVVDKLDLISPAGEGENRGAAVQIAEQLAAISFGLVVFAILFLAIRRRKSIG